MCHHWKKDLIQIIVKFRAEKLSCMFLSCTKYPFKGRKILCTKAVSYAYLKMKRFISGKQLRSWFLKKVSRSACFFTVVLAWIQKNFVPKFQIFSALSLNYLLWTKGYSYQHLYTFSRQECKTFMEKSHTITLDSCYLVTKKCWIWELNLILIASAYGVCKH